MSFRIKNYQTNTLSEPPTATVEPVEVKQVEQRENYVRLRKLKYNEVPTERLPPSEERKQYTENLRQPTPDTTIVKDVIVYDPYTEEWLIVPETDAHKYKTI